MKGMLEVVCNLWPNSQFGCPDSHYAPVSFEVMNRLDNGMMDWLICLLFGWVDDFQKAKDLETADLLNRMPTPQVVRILVEAYQNSEYAMAAKLRIQEILQTQGMVLESGGSQAGFIRQSFTLTRRSFVNMSRDIGYYWLRLVIYIVLSICLGTIYWRVGLEFSSILVKTISLVPCLTQVFPIKNH
jgi:hypothetical protein